LGALLALRHLLNAAPIDARQWVERGGVGLCVAALAAAAPAVRSLAYEWATAEPADVYAGHRFL
jgi:hypothetical protein